MKKQLALALALSTAACTTVTIRPTGGAPLSTEPTYESSKAFFLGGLIGHAKVNVAEICGSKGVSQMQTQQTFLDGLLGGITAGIYAPRTARVWCSK